MLQLLESAPASLSWGFFAGSFATRLGGTCVAKVICIHMRQSILERDKIKAVTNEIRLQGVHLYPIDVLQKYLQEK